MKQLLSAVLCGMVALVVTAPAHAATPVDDAVKALKKSAVYVAPDVTDVSPDSVDTLSAQLRESDNIAIVVLPDGSGDPHQLAGEIDQATGRKRIIGVAIGEEVGTSSSVMPQNEVDDLMTRAKNVSSSSAEALYTFIRNVHEWQAQHPHARASKPTQKKDSGPPWALIALLCVMVAGAIIVIYLIRQRMDYTAPAATSTKFRSSPDDVRELLREIMNLRSQIKDSSLRSIIETACMDTDEYFRRSSRDRALAGDRETFVTHLRSVRQVIVRYIDVQNYERYYDDPDELIRQGSDAIEGFASFVVQSIKRGRRSDLTDFTVDTQILSAQRFT